MALGIAAAVAIVALVPIYNDVRFGNPLDTGYARFYKPLGGLFQTPLHVGLYGHLLSPGQGYLLYVPVLGLIVVAAIAGRSRRAVGGVWLALGIALALHLAVYTRVVFWSGEYAWAIRYHTSLLPLLAVPVTWGLWAAWRWRVGRYAAVAVVAVSVVVQAAGVSLNFGLEHRQRPEAWQTVGHLDLVPGSAAWTWRDSPLRMRFVNLGRKLAGESVLESDSEAERAIMNAWNLFPARASATLGGGVARLLWLLWAGLIAAAAGAACLSWRSLRRRPAEG